MKRLAVPEWLNSLVVTPDARGEIVTALRGLDNPPAHLSHCTYFFCLVRDKLKMTSREHKRAAVALYNEYVVFRRGGDE